MDGGAVFERERELGCVAALAADVVDGAGGTIVFEGQPGLGKSTVLLEACREAAEQGRLRTVRFCCGELEQELAWVAMRGLLGEIHAPAPGDVFATAHALFARLARLAEEEPLLLVLDDAHWCDAPSLQALSYLQRRLHALPAGLIVAMRPPAANAEHALLERLQGGPDTEVHRLTGLGADSVSALIRRGWFPDADPRFCQACHELTAGNPFYVRELLIELRHRGIDAGGTLLELGEVTPPTVLNSLLVRLDRLTSSGATPLARAAAVLGDGVTLSQAAALAEINEPGSAEALDELSAAELLAPGEPLRFVHPLVRTAIYSSIPPGRRAQQHARAAELLDAGRAQAEIVASHLLYAPRAAAAGTVEMLRAAAARANAQGAPQSAVRYLRRALEEPPASGDRVDVLVELAHAETAVGDQNSVSHLAEALELAGDDRRRAAILLDLGWAQHHAARFRKAADSFERGLCVARRLPDHELEASLEAGYLAAATLDSQRVGDALRRIEVIEKRSARIDDPGDRMLLAQVLVTRTMAAAPRREIVELAQRLWADGRLLRDEGADSQALWHVIGALSWADAYEPALGAIDLVLEAAADRGLILAQARARFARAWPHYWMGRLRDASADASAAIEIWHGGLETYLPAAVYWFGLAELELENSATAEAALGLTGPPQRWEGTGMMGFIHSLRGHLALRAGDAEAALGAFQACGCVMETLRIVSPSVMPWRSDAAQALLVLGEAERAAELAEEELRLARACGGSRAEGVALRVCGLSTGGDAGIELLREAVGMQALSGAVLEQARAEIDLGAAIRRGGRRRGARPHLRAGLELAQAAGATGLAHRAETELRAAGGRGRRATDTGAGLLTASERRVAELAAQGYSNRNIAGLLQISVKGVEWHLHQSYRKLDISGRAQLGPALFTEPGWADARRPRQLFLAGAVPKT
jgi:DNA-binding CsgD family transcriptional regulator